MICYFIDIGRNSYFIWFLTSNGLKCFYSKIITSSHDASPDKPLKNCFVNTTFDAAFYRIAYQFHETREKKFKLKPEDSSTILI